MKRLQHSKTSNSVLKAKQKAPNAICYTNHPQMRWNVLMILFSFMPSTEEYDAETDCKMLGKENWDVRHGSLAETEQEHIKEYLTEANASIVSPQTYHLAGELSQAGTHATARGLKSLPKSGSKEPGVPGILRSHLPSTAFSLLSQVIIPEGWQCRISRAAVLPTSICPSVPCPSYSSAFNHTCGLSALECSVFYRIKPIPNSNICHLCSCWH